MESSRDTIEGSNEDEEHGGEDSQEHWRFFRVVDEKGSATHESWVCDQF